MAKIIDIRELPVDVATIIQERSKKINQSRETNHTGRTWKTKTRFDQKWSGRELPIRRENIHLKEIHKERSENHKEKVARNIWLLSIGIHWI